MPLDGSPIWLEIKVVLSMMLSPQSGCRSGKEDGYLIVNKESMGNKDPYDSQGGVNKLVELLMVNKHPLF